MPPRTTAKLRHHVGALAIGGGAASVLASVLADAVWPGASAGFGRRQWFLLLSGGALLLAGAAARMPDREARRLAWARFAALDSLLSVRELVLLALFLGLFTGLGESALLFGDRLLSGVSLQMGVEIAWILPLVDALTLLAVCLALAAAGRFVPVLRSPHVVLPVLAFLCAETLLGHVRFVQRADVGARWLLVLGVTVAAARALGRWRRGGFEHLRPAVVTCAIAAAVIGAGAPLLRAARERFNVSRLAEAAPGAPDVIFIIWDTVRAQELGLYGYERPTAPVLDQLARGGVVFDFALATAPWTLPSHASFFTGRYPNELSTNWQEPLDTTYPTLAEVLRDHGYVTAGFSANLAYVTREFGLHRGFLHFQDFFISPARAVAMSDMLIKLMLRLRVFDGVLAREPGVKPASRINDEARRWLPVRRTRPHFLFFNYMDAHDPYLAPSPFDTLFAPPRPFEIEEWFVTDWSSVAPRKDAYDRSIRYVDAMSGDLLALLEARGYLDNAIVIIASDHGELFGEKGFIGHANALYLPLLRVPLVIRYAGRIPAGLRVTHEVSLRDLPATVLELAGIDSPHAVPGASLTRYWRTPPDSAAGPEAMLYAELRQSSRRPRRVPNHDGDVHAVTGQGYHFIREPDGSEELFHYVSDPREEKNLATSADASAVLATMRRFLEQHLGSDRWEPAGH